MIRRLLPFLLAAMVLAVGLGSAQQPGEPGDPPLRLKKKKRTGDAPAPKLPAKDDKESAKPKDKLPGGKEKPKEDEELDPEDGPANPDEDEKDVLERIGRNMRAVEEKLGNRELGDPTSQQQRDIVKDLDSLIKKQQQNQGGGGGSDDQQQDQQQQNGGEQGKQGERRQQSRGGQGQQRGSSRGKQRQRRQRSGRQRGSQSGQPKGGTGSEQGSQPQQQPGSGNNPGGRGKSSENDKNINADLYKEVWGHLPESLRAEMNAYSNPAPFMPRYDDLIKKYYRTIAEQGRKKGD
jgi:hypothetical protein